MIKFLGSSSYVGASKVSTVTDGMLAYTHIAQLNTTPYQPSFTQCYVKIYQENDSSGREDKSILNEIVGYIIGKSLGLPVPSEAGIIMIKGSQLSSPPDWISEDKEIMAWWVKDMFFPSLKQYYDFSKLGDHDILLNKLVKELLANDSTSQIIAFDDLIANIDRNIGNILKTKNGKFILIDHGLCLTRSDWIASDLKPELPYPNKILELISANLNLQKKHNIIESKRLLFKQIETAISNLRELLQCFIEENDIYAIENFIRNRYASDRFERKVGILV